MDDAGPFQEGRQYASQVLKYTGHSGRETIFHLFYSSRGVADSTLSLFRTQHGVIGTLFVHLHIYQRGGM